jgi:hypothetical protein
MRHAILNVRCNSKIRWMELTALVVGVALAAIIGAGQATMAQPSPDDLADLIFLGTNGGHNPRCGALSVASLASGAMVSEGRDPDATSRMTANRAFTRVVGAPHAGGLHRYYLLDWDPATELWMTRFIRAEYDTAYPELAPGIALDSTGDILYTSIFSHSENMWGLAQYDLNALREDGDGNLMLPEYTRFVGTDQTLITRMEIDSARKLAHLIGYERNDNTKAKVVTIDLESFEHVGDPVPFRSMVPPMIPDRTVFYTALAPDERFLVVNGWYRPAMTIVDLTARTAVTVTIPSDTDHVGGIAFSRGPENGGRVAIHTGDHVIIGQLDTASATFREIDRVAIPSPHWRRPPYNPAPGALAWSGDGSHVIAVSDADEGSFAVISVTECGLDLTVEAFLQPCAGSTPRVHGIDVLTANRYDAAGSPQCGRTTHPAYIPYTSAGR